MDTVVARCRELARRWEPSLADVLALLNAVDADPDSIDRWRRPDPRHPYGRQVIVDEPRLEAMIATWTPATPCAPHDHGGSAGGVRILAGQATHREWAIDGDRLVLVDESTALPGDVIVCRTDLVHSMVDAGSSKGLVTLHVYVTPIAEMVVYDVAAARTLVVGGRCGAWVPVDAPHLVRKSASGYLPGPQLLAEGST